MDQDQAAVLTHWPETKPDDWCSEYYNLDEARSDPPEPEHDTTSG